MALLAEKHNSKSMSFSNSKGFGSSPSNPDPGDDRNWNKVNERFLERQLDKQGTSPHSIKQEYLGKKAEIKKYDLHVDKNTGQIGIFEQVTGKLVEITSYFI